MSDANSNFMSYEREPAKRGFASELREAPKARKEIGRGSCGERG